MTQSPDHRPRVGKPSAIAVLASFIWPVAASGQSIEQELSRTAASDNIGGGFQTVAVLGGTPGTSSTRLEADDAKIETFKLHVQHRFTRRDDTGQAITSPFVEATYGRGKADETILSDPGRVDPYRLDLDFRSRSLLLGGGLIIPVGPDVRITPMVLAGLSNLRINSLYTGANAAIVNEYFDGLLNRARIRTVFAGPAAQIDYRGTVFGTTRLTATARYNHIFNLSTSLSDPGLEPRGSASLATAIVKFETPTRFYLGEREVFGGIFARGTALSATSRRQFGFDRYGEVGGTVMLDYPTERGLAIGFYGSVLRGPGVRGHSLGVVLRFAGFAAAGPT